MQTKTKLKVIKSFDTDGNELISLADEQDNNLGVSLTMESIFEERVAEELDATSILDKEQLVSLVAPAKPKRLIINNQILEHVASGVLFRITMGHIPPIDERIEKDITGCFITIEPTTGGESLSMIVPFTKTGEIVPGFQYRLVETHG